MISNTEKAPWSDGALPLLAVIYDSRNFTIHRIASAKVQQSVGCCKQKQRENSTNMFNNIKKKRTMTHFRIELTITDDRFINPSDLGHNTICRTIHKGHADNDEVALSEAEKICGTLTAGQFNMDTTGRKYRTWLRHHTLHEEYKFNSSLVVTFRTEL